VRILAIADRNPGIDLIATVSDLAIDIIVTLGDLERHDLLQLAQITHIPKIGVYGNHCSGNYMEELGIINMHLKTLEYGGISFGGLQGCVRYKENPDAIMSTQEETWTMMQNFPRVDIFITHCPPRGVNDEDEVAHQGFDALRAYIETKKPNALLHGHTYPTEETMIRKFDQTEIVYVHKSRIVELGPF